MCLCSCPHTPYNSRLAAPHVATPGSRVRPRTANGRPRISRVGGLSADRERFDRAALQVRTGSPVTCISVGSAYEGDLHPEDLSAAAQGSSRSPTLSPVGSSS
jgi:hypothetical protein